MGKGNKEWMVKEKYTASIYENEYCTGSSFISSALSNEFLQ